MATMSEAIRRCRQNLGSPPRQLPPEERRSFRLRPSLYVSFLFLLRRDKLRLILRDQDLLRDCGRVVWGFLVQANNILFDPANRQVLPANVIYSPDQYFDGRVSVLEGIAHKLFELKGTSPRDKELRRFARAITDELLRTMRLPLPGSLCENREVYFTTCFVQPSHLPDGYLAASYFPLVISPEQTEAVMILPSAYWPDELRAAWGEDIG
jgi:hypothetical protein